MVKAWGWPGEIDPSAVKLATRIAARLGSGEVKPMVSKLPMLSPPNETVSSALKALKVRWSTTDVD